VIGARSSVRSEDFGQENRFLPRQLSVLGVRLRNRLLVVAGLDFIATEKILSAFGQALRSVLNLSCGEYRTAQPAPQGYDLHSRLPGRPCLEGRDDILLRMLLFQAPCSDPKGILQQLHDYTRGTTMDSKDSQIIDRILEVSEKDIVPLTQAGVRAGNKVFGAAILRKADLSLVVASTNTETENPLWHGEVHTLKRLYEMPRNKRPDPKDCLFFATHEPCPLCLSAITWGGYDNFFYSSAISTRAIRSTSPMTFAYSRRSSNVTMGNTPTKTFIGRATTC
jgi:tRNA(Arg) A34 adenosine deaminase TadA